MEGFLQAIAAVLLAVILGLVLAKQSKDWAVLLTTGVSCMVLAVGAVYLQPVLDFVRELQTLSGLDPQMLTVVLKAVGIGLISEIAALICLDAGNAALGKGIQILASLTVLWLSLPLMRALLELVQKILGEL
jgi:stage III sporulation protein AD